MSAAPAARWGILAVPATLYFLSYFHRIAPVVVAADLMQAFGVGAAALGLLTALYPYVFGLMGIPAGTLADTLGPRRTLTAGGLTMGAGAALFGLAPGFELALAARLLVGLGASVMLVASLRLAAAWFRTDEFATISGGSQMIGSLGALAATTPLAVLADAFGWRGTFAGIGALTLALAVACHLTVRDRPPDRAPAPGAAPPGPTGGEIRAGLRSVAGNRRTWFAALASAGIYAGFATFIGLWGVPYLVQVHGLTRRAASGVVAWAAIGLLLGAPAIGWASDRWLRRRKPLLLGAAAASALVWAALVLPPRPLPLAWLPGLCFVLGFASGGLAVVFACIREVNDPRYVGVAMGMHNVPVFLGFGLMQWLTGLVLDWSWEGAQAGGVRVYGADAFRAAFALCLGAGLAATAMAAGVTETRCENVWGRSAARARR